MSPAKLLLGVAALLAANYALTELMDDSGLSVVVVRGALPAAPADPTAEASFRARAAATAAELLAADGSVVRLDVARAKAAAAGPPAFELMLVSRSAGAAAAELPAALAAASGEEGIWLHVEKDNAAAVSLYETEGFVAKPEVPPYVGFTQALNLAHREPMLLYMDLAAVGAGSE